MELGRHWATFLSDVEVKELAKITGPNYFLTKSLNTYYDSFSDFIWYQFKYLYKSPSQETLDRWKEISKRNVS